MNTGRSHGILWCRSACLLYNEGRFLSLRVLRWIEKEAFMNAAWGYAGMALAVASLPFKHWTNYEAQITRHTIEDAAWQGRGRLRIALVSDFHDGDGIWSGRALARLVRKEQVDLICITGDLFTPDRDGREALAFLDDVCEWRPIYFVTGNHDEGMPEAALLKERIGRVFGVHVLDNRKVRVRVKEGWVEIFGVRDRTAYASEDAWLWELQQLLTEAAPPEEDYRILLCHRPEQTALFDQLRQHLVLSGHAHGGQWRLGRRGVYAPGQGVLPHYTRGIYKRRKKAPYTLAVSSGFAVDPLIPRLGNRPELVILDIVAPKR